MLLRNMRWVLASVTCGGMLFGAGCGALITDSILRIGLATAISQLLSGLGLGGGSTG